MIVIGVDPHKRSHTAAGVCQATGELREERTVSARRQGHEQLLAWARALAQERLWALEDCRHVSGALERFLIGRGERVVRVPPRLMGAARKGGRSCGKSDAIDALAVARAALREPELAVAFLAGSEREIRLLHDHREDLVCERTRIQNRLRWHLHELDPELEVPTAALDRRCWLERIGRRLGRLEPTAQARIGRELLVRCRELTRRINELERELELLLQAEAGELLELVGCGPLTAAKLVGEVAGVERFGGEAKLAKHSGAAPLPASSGEKQRHRLNRTGNRSSTARCIGSRSRRRACIRRHAPTWPARRPRARAGGRRCAASNGTSPAPSTTACERWNDERWPREPSRTRSRP
jgi:transposase